MCGIHVDVKCICALCVLLCVHVHVSKTCAEARRCHFVLLLPLSSLFLLSLSFSLNPILSKLVAIKPHVDIYVCPAQYR